MTSQHAPPARLATLVGRVLTLATYRRVRRLCNLILALAIGLQWLPVAAAAGTVSQRAIDANRWSASAQSNHYSANFFAPPPAGTITNTVSVGSTTNDPNTLNNTAVATTTVTSVADLQISKTDGFTAVTPGTAITYTIVVTNAGPSAVTNAPVVDNLPAAISSATWTCSATAGSSCDAASGADDINTTVDLIVGGKATFTVVANIIWTATGTLVNTATVATPTETTDPTPGNNSSTDTDTLLTGTLTGTVYLDTNDSNSEDNGEGLAGVTVVITTSVGVTLTVTTDSNGHFTATVPAGTTQVDVDDSDLPTGVVQIEGTDPTTVTVPAGGSASDVNGYELEGQLYGHIFEDVNGDGDQDAGEPNLANVDVIVTDTYGVTQTVTTDANGNYTATVPLGNGSTLTDTATVDVVESTLPAGAVQTAGTDPTTVIVKAGDAADAGDDGYQRQGIVTGVVYMDEDGDGVYTAGVDTPLDNVTVVITDSNSVIYTVVTNSNGAYTQTVPAGNTTVDIANNDTDLPSGVVLTGGSSDQTTVNVPGGGTARDDTGYVLLANIGDFVWLDLNGDGVQDANEPGLADIVVKLTLPNNTVITTTTGPNGNFNFSDLRPGDYTIAVDTATLPDGVTQTFDRDGTLNDSTNVTLVSNGSLTDVDFGYQGNASIGDLIWRDRNGDGQKTADEPGLAGVVISLTMSNGWVVTTTSNSSGDYAFGGLIPGAYTMTVDSTTLPTGSVQTADRDSTLDNKTVVTLTAGDEIMDTDFGYQRQGDLTGFVFEDIDGSGDWSAGEPGLANVTVIITDSRGITQNVQTDSNGYYTVTVAIDSNTSATDTVTVNVVESTLLAQGYVYTAGTDPQTVTVTANTTTNAGDDGYQRQGVVEGVVYEDVNQNGVYNVGTDIPLTVQVTITDSNGVTYTVTTNAAGYFSQTVPYGATTVDVSNGSITSISPELMLANGAVDPATVNVPAGGSTRTNFPYVEPLVIDKDVVSANVVAGTQVTYTIVVRNLGATTLTNVTISDTLPMSFTYAGSTIAAVNANRSSTVDPTLGTSAPRWGAWTLNAGGAVTVTLTATVASSVVPSVYDNTAYADSDQTSLVDDNGTTGQDDNTPTGKDPEGDDDVTVRTVADLAVAKYDTPDPVVAGTTLTYTIVVTNYGPSDAQNVVITDTLTADVTFVSANGCTLNGSQVVCNFGTIANGTTKSVTIVVTVDPDLLVAAANDGSTIVEGPAPAPESATAAPATQPAATVPLGNGTIAALATPSEVLAAATPVQGRTAQAEAALAALAQGATTPAPTIGYVAGVASAGRASPATQGRAGPLALM